MKKYVMVLILIGLLSCSAFAALDEGLIDDYARLYAEEIQDGIENVDSGDMGKALPEFDAEKLLTRAAKGENLFSIKELILKVLELLFGEIKRTLRMLVIIPVIAVLNTYLTGMQKNFRTKGAVSAAFFTCYAVMAGMAAAAFIETVKCGRGMIENVAVFMRALLPVSLASIASSGAVVSATSFEIVLISVIEISEFAVEKLFIPLVMMATALNIANNLSLLMNAEKLVQLINKFVKWGVGLLTTLFVGVTGLQGIAAGSADGLAVKLTKFATSNVVPMVGGILAETVETVMNCSVVIKNAVGVVGIIAVIGIAVIPLLKMTACLILFRVCAAVIQPISDERYVKCLTQLGDSVSAILAMAVAVVVMFVIILTIIINIGSAAVLLGR